MSYEANQDRSGYPRTRSANPKTQPGKGDGTEALRGSGGGVSDTYPVSNSPNTSKSSGGSPPEGLTQRGYRKGGKG